MGLEKKVKKRRQAALFKKTNSKSTYHITFHQVGILT
jgi:hypothetical protein